jgi:hypothetical protein
MDRLGKEARAILDRGRRAYEPDGDAVAEHKRKVDRAIAAGALLVPAHAASAGIGKASGALGLGWKVTLAVFGGIAAGAIAWVALGPLEMGSPREPATPPAREADREPEREVAPEIEPPVIVEQPEEPAPPVEPETDPPADPPASRPRVMVEPMGVDALREEARLMREVERLLREGRPAEALPIVREVERRFPHGALAIERRAARIEALCAVGQVERARPLAERFAASGAPAHLVTRVERACRP